MERGVKAPGRAVPMSRVEAGSVVEPGGNDVADGEHAPMARSSVTRRRPDIRLGSGAEGLERRQASMPTYESHD